MGPQSDKGQSKLLLWVEIKIDLEVYLIKK